MKKRKQMILKGKLRFNKAGLNFVLLLAAVACLLATAVWQLGYRINLTPSMEVGIWKVMSFSLQNGRGQVVIVEKAIIPQAGQHRGKYDLLKRVLALPGDRIEYDGEALLINGERIAKSRIFLVDQKGNPLPQINYPLIIPEGFVWLSSDNVFGYDSRYYGPVMTSAIRHRAVLLWRLK